MWLKKYNNMSLQDYLSIITNKDAESIDKIAKYNHELVEDFPFLKPTTDYWTGKELNTYDYSYTWLDDMPEGWRLAFGESLVQDLKTELEKSNCVETYKIVLIKEKFGGLRWYDNGCTQDWIKTILPKYEKLSFVTCINCGLPAKYETTGWIVPLCEDCAIKLFNKNKEFYGSSDTKFEDVMIPIEDL